MNPIRLRPLTAVGGREPFWVAVPVSLLIHAAGLLLMMLWLSGHDVRLPELPTLTVTLIESPAVLAESASQTPRGDSPPATTASPTAVTRAEPREPVREPLPEPKAAHEQRRPEAIPAQAETSSGSRRTTAAVEEPAHRTLPERPERAQFPDTSSRATASPTSAAIDPMPDPQQTAAIESAYLAEVRRAIEEARYYPRRARRLGQQGTVELSFEILADGRIARAEVQAGSGSRSLDSAALDILDRVGRFAPLPDTLQQPSLMVRLPVDYRLY